MTRCVRSRTASVRSVFADSATRQAASILGPQIPGHAAWPSARWVDVARRCPPDASARAPSLAASNARIGRDASQTAGSEGRRSSLRMNCDQRRSERQKHPENECLLDECERVVREHRDGEACDGCGETRREQAFWASPRPGDTTKPTNDPDDQPEPSGNAEQPDVEEQCRAIGCRGSGRCVGGCRLRSVSCPDLARGSAGACLR